MAALRGRERPSLWDPMGSHGRHRTRAEPRTAGSRERMRIEGDDYRKRVKFSKWPKSKMAAVHGRERPSLWGPMGSRGAHRGGVEARTAGARERMGIERDDYRKRVLVDGRATTSIRSSSCVVVPCPVLCKIKREPIVECNGILQIQVVA